MATSLLRERLTIRESVLTVALGRYSANIPSRETASHEPLL